MVGTKEEVTGTITLSSNYTIDFTKLEKGSDLWMFYQVSDFGTNWTNLQVMLTPSFAGRVWYKKDSAKKTLTIFGTETGEVSYRMTSNSFNYKAWPTITNLNPNDYVDMGEKK